MSPKRNWLNVLAALVILVLFGCKAAIQQEELGSVCCRECLEAFNQSPVGVGASGANCGDFPSAKPISDRCARYFEEHPQTVAACETASTETKQ